jgi:hypothetical protein
MSYPPMNPVLPVLAFCLAVTGCSGPCNTLQTTGTSDSTLTVTESANLIGEERDAGEGDAWIAAHDPPDQPVTQVFTQFHSPVAPGAAPSMRCLEVETYGAPITLNFDCPAGPGSYRLEDLHAVACDTVCGSLAGTLTVEALVLPCGQGGCGRLEADLDLPTPTTDPVGPAVTGQAHLSYSESVDRHTCPASLSDG